MKIVKIIATSFFPRSIRENTILAGNPPAYSLHSQNFKNSEEIKKLILFNIQKENECNPGLPVDLVFVNNNVGNEEGNRFIDTLVNKKLKNGKIRVIQNNNIGWSYGAFSRGFETFKDCKNSGLKGIVLKAKKNIIINKKKCLRFANNNQIFLKVI